MKASKKAKRKLQARQAEYDAMVRDDERLSDAYHRPGSLKK